MRPPPPSSPEVEDDALDPPPKLADLPEGSPVRAWFEAAIDLDLEPAPARGPEPADDPEPEVDAARWFGPELLLLRERPPEVQPSDVGTSVDGPRLVILTRLSLHPVPGGDAVELELAGAGAVAPAIQAIDSNRARLSIADAGAVPGFLAARPARAEVEVVDVTRRGRVVEIEVEFGRGWSLREVTRLDNGARVRFEPE
ncbi:hypothetical protein ENSA5_63200 [Enhygromyxa salina]|uniref:AMIN domain-containing protein n=1 Tax=Enhygromyxa salina TaxID=215803 RepID=A0A2S9XCM2_9BACT|nr:hypothetical protein ENSA5_63200 [Enhygromyxa salina]